MHDFGIKKLVLPVALSALFATSACSKKKATVKPPAPTSCEEFKKTLPASLIQGTVEVPEDYDNPAGPKTHVFYYGHIGQGDNATIVFFNGGPGGDSHSSYLIMNPLIEQASASAQLPILYVDQRGTGCSDPFPAVNDVTTAQRVAHFGSKEIVKDAEVIRKKLQGDRKWKVFGQSFGGLIGKRYLQVAPEGIRSLHIHGLSSTNDQVGWLKTRIEAQHRVAQDFFNKYPGDLDIYNQVESLLSDSFCISSGSQKYCGKPLLYTLTELLGFNDYWPYMDELLHSFLKDGQLNRDGFQKYGKEALFGNSVNTNSDAGAVIAWVDMGDSSYANICRQIIKELTAAGETPLTWPLYECKAANLETSDDIAGDTQVNLVLQQVPQNTMTLDTWVATVNLHPDIPIFLYSGGEDSFVPVETYSEEVKALGSKIHYLNFPNSGHEGFETEGQVWSDLLYDTK